MKIVVYIHGRPQHAQAIRTLLIEKVLPWELPAELGFDVKVASDPDEFRRLAFDPMPNRRAQAAVIAEDWGSPDNAGTLGVECLDPGMSDMLLDHPTVREDISGSLLWASAGDMDTLCNKARIMVNYAAECAEQAEEPVRKRHLGKAPTRHSLHKLSVAA